MKIRKQFLAVMALMTVFVGKASADMSGILKAKHSSLYITVTGVLDNYPLMQRGTTAGDALQKFNLKDFGGGMVSLINVSSNKCATIFGTASQAFGPAVLRNCSQTLDQKFIFMKSADGSYEIRTFGNSKGLCLGFAGASMDSGSKLIQLPCDASASQRFFLTGTGTISSSVAATAPTSAPVPASTTTTSGTGDFKGAIKVKHSSRYLTVTGLLDNYPVMQRDTAIGDAHLNFYLKDLGGGVFTLLNISANKCGTIIGSESQVYGSVVLRNCAQTQDQKFALLKSADGSYEIRSFGNSKGLCLGFADANMDSGAKLIQLACDASASQRFFLPSPISSPAPVTTTTTLKPVVTTTTVPGPVTVTSTTVPGPVTVPSVPVSGIRINTQAELDSALAKAVGGEVFSLSGSFKLNIRNTTWSKPVTLTSYSLSSPALITWSWLSGINNLTLKQLDIGGPGIDYPSVMVSFVDSGSNITLDTVHVHGSLDNNSGNDGSGVRFQNIKNVTVINSVFEQLYQGLKFENTSNVKVINNSFHDIRADGILASTMVNGLIDRNYMTDFYPLPGRTVNGKYIDGDHPDCIQFMQGGPSSDVVITNNACMLGKGKESQGIFVVQTAPNTYSYTRFRIENNVVAQIMNNGIMLLLGVDCIIKNNTVVYPTDYKDYGFNSYSTYRVSGDIAMSGNIGVNGNKTQEQAGINPALLKMDRFRTLKPSDLVISGIGYQLVATAPPPVTTTPLPSVTTTTTVTTTTVPVTVTTLPAVTTTTVPISSGGSATVNPNSTLATKNLLQKIIGYQQAGKMVSGQFLGHQTSSLSPVDQIKSITGEYVGMIGVDYYQMQAGTPQWTEANKAFVNYWSRGGLVNVSAHMSNPCTGGPVKSSGCPIAQVLIEGSAANINLKKHLDGIAAGLMDLQNKGVVVLFRPFHEMNGSWFWWGNQAEDYKKLWIYTFNYYTKTKKLNNLLWWFTPDCYANSGIKFYPGNAYVDLVGLDIYTDNLNSLAVPSYNDLIATGKPFSISEAGPKTIPASGVANTYNWSNFLGGVKTYYPKTVLFQAWSGPWSLYQNSTSKTLVTDPKVLNLPEL